MTTDEENPPIFPTANCLPTLTPTLILTMKPTPTLLPTMTLTCKPFGAGTRKKGGKKKPVKAAKPAPKKKK